MDGTWQEIDLSATTYGHEEEDLELPEIAASAARQRGNWPLKKPVPQPPLTPLYSQRYPTRITQTPNPPPASTRAPAPQSWHTFWRGNRVNFWVFLLFLIIAVILISVYFAVSSYLDHHETAAQIESRPESTTSSSVQVSTVTVFPTVPPRPTLTMASTPVTSPMHILSTFVTIHTYPQPSPTTSQYD